MQCSNKNTTIIAAAGSRKTTQIVDDALALQGAKILLTTYTNENVAQIENYLIRRRGCIPPNIKVLSWFSFLLRHGAYPYQNYITDRRLRSIDYIATPPRGVPKTRADRYFIDSRANVYSKVLTDFIVECNNRSGGLVVKRLEKIFDHIFLDEVQDLNGYDLDFLELLFRSSIAVCAVGDPRQCTYLTNRSNKNKRYQGLQIIDWFKERERDGLCTIEERNECYRSNQAICDFADTLYTEQQKTKSLFQETTDHDGVFVISPDQVESYYQTYKPQVLVHDKTQGINGYPSLNFGVSKGHTFPRVMIIPTEPIKRYLETGINKLPQRTQARLYVAVTRARHSVVFVYDGKKDIIVERYNGN